MANIHIATEQKDAVDQSVTSIYQANFSLQLHIEYVSNSLFHFTKVKEVFYVRFIKC